MAALIKGKTMGRSGMGVAFVAGVLMLHGCMVDPPCGCSPQWDEVPIQVADAQGPADSARVEVFLASDTVPFRDSARTDPGWSVPGRYTIFDDGDAHLFPEGKDSLEIRVTARKGDRRGEALLVMGRKPGSYRIFKRSGPDTLLIR